MEKIGKGWIERLLMPKLNEISGEIKTLEAKIESLEKVTISRFGDGEDGRTRSPACGTRAESKCIVPGIWELIHNEIVLSKYFTCCSTSISHFTIIVFDLSNSPILSSKSSSGIFIYTIILIINGRGEDGWGI